MAHAEAVMTAPPATSEPAVLFVVVSVVYWNSSPFLLLLNRMRRRRTLSCAWFGTANLTSRIAMVLPCLGVRLSSPIRLPPVHPCSSCRIVLWIRHALNDKRQDGIKDHSVRVRSPSGAIGYAIGSSFVCIGDLFSMFPAVHWKSPQFSCHELCRRALNIWFILVKLMDIRKEVQCPICLGIIRKTRTVMECLHRFCRDCIDKSMRLGNNECPACRTHCASRRSLRDDPNYDALILALYPDIDKYEEEELAFGEEERTRNKKIQASIAETFRRQTEALGKKRSTTKEIGSASSRKSQGNMRARRRGRTSSPDIVPTDLDDDDREENGNDGSKESSSVDDRSPDVRQKRARRWPMPRSSPAKTISSIDSNFEDNDDLGGGRDILTTSPLRGEMLAWGKNGTRSQTRHGNAGGSSGRMVKGGRVAKLVDHLRNADEFDSKFNLYLVLLPLDGQSMPKLEKSYLSCQSTLSVRHLCQFVALQLSRQAKEVEIFIRKNPRNGCFATKDTSTYATKLDRFDGLERLKEERSLSELYPSLASGQGDLELLYSLKTEK